VKQHLLFTETELRNLFTRKEGQFIEFKSLWDRSKGKDKPHVLNRRKARDLVAESVAAFANADGGTLILGVEDDGQVTGHAYPEEAVKDLLAVPERRLHPPVQCRYQRTVIDDKEVLIFQVPIAAKAVMVEGNGFPYRVGDQVVKEPQEVINARKEAYRRVGYEQRVHSDATFEDIDLDLVRNFISHTVFQERSVEEVLEHYGLILPRADGFAITNACLLLFGKQPMVRWHPRAGIRFFRVSGKERRHGPRRNVVQFPPIELPIAAAIPEAYRVAKEQIRQPEKLHDLFFREIPEYPDFAWQEAIVNAFAHRDYEDKTREIEVWFFDDRMEVISPGELIPPVTLGLLRQRKRIHASRNPLIVRVLVDAGLMREEGEGIPRMFEEMEESFLHVPELRVENGAFSVTLRNEPIFSGPVPEWQHIIDTLRLSTAQKRVLLAYPNGFTNEDYRRVNQVDRDQAYREIQEMVIQGVIQAAKAHGRGAVYKISPELRNKRDFLVSKIPVLRRYFSKHESLKNADYRRIFGVERNIAKAELKQLVDEGYLQLQGERRGSCYVPGPVLLEHERDHKR